MYESINQQRLNSLRWKMENPAVKNLKHLDLFWTTNTLCKTRVRAIPWNSWWRTESNHICISVTRLLFHLHLMLTLSCKCFAVRNVHLNYSVETPAASHLRIKLWIYTESVLKHVLFQVELWEWTWSFDGLENLALACKLTGFVAPPAGEEGWRGLLPLCL